MCNKQKLLLPSIVPYLNCLDDINDEEIKLITSFLEPAEHKRLQQYYNVSKTTITKKRLFLYICNLIDFKEINNRKEKNTI